jgi:hypothetical protein
MIKLNEQLKLGIAVEAKDYRSAGSLYNGVASASNTYIDTTGKESLLIMINAGVIGAGNTLDVLLKASSVDDPAAATAISGAAFTQLTPSNDQQLHCAELNTAERKPYIWVETFKTGTGSCNVGITYALQSSKQPESNSPVFDLDLEP